MCKHVVTWGGMCILFEICKKTPFQKCMGWGRGGGLPFFSVAQHIGRCTQTWHCTVHPFLFRITVIVSIPFFRQGWDPIRADIPLFVDRDILRHVAKPWVRLSIPELGSKSSGLSGRQWHAPCGSMRVAVSGRYGAFLPGYQAHAQSPAPTLHPQSEPFCAPTAFVMHPGKQQPVV